MDTSEYNMYHSELAGLYVVSFISLSVSLSAGRVVCWIVLIKICHSLMVEVLVG